MIAQPPHGLNAHVRADGRKLFAQEADVDLHMVLHRVRVKAPDLGQNGLLGHILPLCLQKIPHHVEFPRGQPQLPLPADQRSGRQIERRIAERERVDLRALPPEQRTDAGQQLPRVKGLREIIIRARVQPLDAVFERACRRIRRPCM